MGLTQRIVKGVASVFTSSEDEKAIANFKINKNKLAPILARKLVREKYVIVGAVSELNDIFIKFARKRLNQDLVNITSGEINDFEIRINDIEIYDGRHILGLKAMAYLGIIRRELTRYAAARKLDKRVYSEFQKFMNEFFARF